MNTDLLKDILDSSGTKKDKQRRLRKYARAIDKMRSTLAILHTWCKHDPRRTTHDQIVGLIDATLSEVFEIEQEVRR
jgi:hypothetical protein